MLELRLTECKGKNHEWTNTWRSFFAPFSSLAQETRKARAPRNNRFGPWNQPRPDNRTAMDTWTATGWGSETPLYGRRNTGVWAGNGRSDSRRNASMECSRGGGQRNVYEGSNHHRMAVGSETVMIRGYFWKNASLQPEPQLLVRR